MSKEPPTAKTIIAELAGLVWLRLKQLAYSTGQTVYQLNHGLLSNYLIQQLKHPTLNMTLL
jgi:hypothetical protein